MNQPFTAEEIKSAIRSLRNNRSVGDDQIKAEILKSAPDILHKLLADIYNISDIYNIYNNSRYQKQVSIPQN